MSAVIRFPFDVTAAERRALAAPDAEYDAFRDSLWIGWHAPDDDESDGEEWCSGRVIGIMEGDWHAGSPDPGEELWAFFAYARRDVLALVSKVRGLEDEVTRLRAELAAASLSAAA